jgi:hypothetical protein
MVDKHIPKGVIENRQVFLQNVKTLNDSFLLAGGVTMPTFL